MHTGGLTSPINFVHAEEREQENGVEMEILFPRTRQKGLGAYPLLTEVWSVWGDSSTEFYGALS